MKFHALLHFIGLFGVVCKTNKLASRTFIHDHHVFETQAIRFFNESIIGRLEKGEKGTNLLAECGVSKQQISDIRKNKETSMKFADILETSEGLKRKSLKVAHDEQLDKALYAWFIQQ